MVDRVKLLDMDPDEAVTMEALDSCEIERVTVSTAGYTDSVSSG